MVQQKKVSTVKVSDLAMTFVRRWPIILLCTFICAGLGLLAGVAAPKSYTATATLTVAPITTNPFSSAAVNQQINITTERAILASGEVAAIAAQELGETISTGSLQSNTETAAPSGSQILQVSVTLADPQRAANQANALAKAYLQFRSQDAAEVADGYIKQIDERLKGLNSGGSQTDGQFQQIQDLQQQRTALTLASASPGRLIGSATAPTEPSSMGVLVFATAGTVGGLLVGLTLALVRESIDGKVRSATRQRALFDNGPVVLNDEDQEPVRWLVRTVRLSGARDPGAGTIFVAVITLPASGPWGLPTWLASVARHHQLDVLAVGSHDFTADAVDLGWPVRDGDGGWNDSDIVFVDVGSDITGTRLADLCDRMDLVLLSAGRRTPLKALRETLNLLQTFPAARIIPIFYVPSARRRQRHKKAARTMPAPLPNTRDKTGAKAAMPPPKAPVPRVAAPLATGARKPTAKKPATTAVKANLVSRER